MHNDVSDPLTKEPRRVPLQQLEPGPKNEWEMIDATGASSDPAMPERSTPHLAPDQHIERVYRHALPVRIDHWLHVVCLFILIMSGLQSFNAHPALYWGDQSDRDTPLLSICPMQTDSGEMRGITTIGGSTFGTTGGLG